MRIHLDQRYVIAASGALALVLAVVLAVTAYQIVGEPLAELSQADDDVVADTEVLGATETATDGGDEQISEDATASRDLARPDDDVIRATAAAGAANDTTDEDDSAGAGALALVAETAEISGRAWIDIDGDGIQDPGEPGNPGVTVVLVNNIDDESQRTTTDDDGNYTFIVAPNTYSLFFDIELASMSPRNQGTDTTDSDVGPGGFGGTDGGVTATITIAAGEVDNTKDAGTIPILSGIDIDVKTNGQDSDAAPGEELEFDSTVTFTYEVVNTGNVTLTQIAVSDNVIGPITCFTNTTEPSLGVGESVSCTATANAIDGQYASEAIVSATPVDSVGEALRPVEATDATHYLGVVPFDPTSSVSIVTTTNGSDDNTSPGVQLSIGEAVDFAYEVTNTGKTSLTDVAVSDTVLGDICTFPLLAPGETKTCPTVASVVTDGPYRSVGNVSATPVDQDGQPLDSLVTSSDESFHVGAPITVAECSTNLSGPRMLAGGTVVDETGYVAQAGSTIRIVTSEPGASPDQPNEQVYIQVGNDIYGPTPIDLGSFEFTPTATGPVVILHYSEVTGDLSRANSVEYEWCGTDLSVQTFHQCPAAVDGPRMQRNNNGTVEWDSGLTAAPGSTIEITTSEPGTSPGQPHEQLYIFVGDEQFGPTPNDHTTTTITVGAGGPVVVKHYSVLNETSFDSNSVEFSLCGSNLTKTR